jgi:hypothetical protein
MATRAEKRMALLQFRAGLPHVSGRALAAIVKQAQLGELPDIDNAKTVRNQLRTARDNFCLECTPFGPMHRTLELAPGFEVEMQVPSATFWKLRNEAGWNELLQIGKVGASSTVL